MQQNMTCRDIAKAMIENFDAEAPVYLVDRDKKFHISELEIVKTGRGECHIEIRLDPLNGGTQ